jgi:hypothetical protein
MKQPRRQQPIHAACLLSVLLTFGNPFPAVGKAEPSDSIKELKEKRLALLVRIYKATEERSRIDVNLPSDEVHKTKIAVDAARLDLAETKEDRVKACEDIVRSAEGWEKHVTDLVKNGHVSPTELLKAQANVLETRIALEKAHAQGRDK